MVDMSGMLGPDSPSFRRPFSHLTAPQHRLREMPADRLRLESRGQGTRWRRQLKKIERQLGGDPRKTEPPKGNARRTFDRLAARHALNRAKLTAHAEERLRRKLQKRPTDLAELSAMRRALGLPTMERMR
jgi:hypothetical protein